MRQKSNNIPYSVNSSKDVAIGKYWWLERVFFALHENVQQNKTPI